MIRKLKHIVLLYLREPGFIILSTLSFLSLCAMQAVIYWGIERNLWNDNFVSIAIGHQKSIEILVHKYVLGDELLSFVFILGLWLMFTFGLLIKKQFANERAVIGNGFVLCFIIMTEFLLVGNSPTQWILVNAVLCLILSTLFLKLSFEKWMDKEF